MKVIITSNGKELESQVAQKFESSPYCLFVETVNMGHEAIPNDDTSKHSDTGIDIVQSAIERGVEVVITGDIGDTAHEAFSNAGITVVTNCNGTVKKHLNSLITHEYEETQLACV